MTEDSDCYDTIFFCHLCKNWLRTTDPNMNIRWRCGECAINLCFTCSPNNPGKYILWFLELIIVIPVENHREYSLITQIQLNIYLFNLVILLNKKFTREVRIIQCENYTLLSILSTSYPYLNDIA